MPVRISHLVIHDGNIGTQLTEVGWLELASLQFDDNITPLRYMEEQQIDDKLIDVAVLIGNSETHLTAHKSHPATKLHQSVLKTVHQRLLSTALIDSIDIG